MSQEAAEAVDPKTDADEEALERAVAAGRSGAPPAGRTIRARKTL